MFVGDRVRPEGAVALLENMPIAARRPNPTIDFRQAPGPAKQWSTANCVTSSPVNPHQAPHENESHRANHAFGQYESGGPLGLT